MDAAGRDRARRSPPRSAASSSASSESRSSRVPLIERWCSPAGSARNRRRDRPNTTRAGVAPARHGRMALTVNGEVSWWWCQLGGPRVPGPPLAGSTDADVAIVGARTHRTLDGVLPQTSAARPADRRARGSDRRVRGIRPQRRWLHDSFPGGRERYEKSHGRGMRARPAAGAPRHRRRGDRGGGAGAHRRRRREGRRALGRPHAGAARAPAGRAAAEPGWAQTDLEAVGGRGDRERISIASALGAACTRTRRASIPRSSCPDSPARSRDSASRSASAPGVEIAPGRASPSTATCSAFVLRATEGFTADLAGEHRTWLPMNSSMIVTDPLPDSAWDVIGWSGREVRRPGARLHVRTAHGRRSHRLRRTRRAVSLRLARSDTDGATRSAPSPHYARSATCSRGVPMSRSRTRGRECSACRATGARRSGWTAATGLGWAGGYVGDGVTRDQPRRTHARRPGAAPRHRAHRAAVGRPPRTRLGARAAALAGSERDLHRLSRGRQGRGVRTSHDLADRKGRRPDRRALTALG